MTIDLRYGDTIEQMKLISDKSIDFICCDLPYGTTACKWDSIIPFDKLWEQYERIIKPNGAIALFGSEPFSSALRVSNLKLFRYDWIWQKTKGGAFATCNKMPLKRHEIISIFYKKMPTYNPQKTKAPDEKIDKRKIINNPITSKDDTYKGLKVVRKKDDGFRFPISVLQYNSVWYKGMHETEKPIPLLEYLILTYSNENDTILDNTFGSCTTGIACINTNRNFIGIENNMDYFNISLKRVEEKRKEKDFNLITSFGDGM